MKKMEDFLKNTMSLGRRGTDKTMNSHNVQGKNEKFLKTILKKTLKVQNTRFFAIGMSREQIAKNPCDEV